MTMLESLDEILERRRNENEGCSPPATLGKHPRYDSWPDEVKFPVIKGERWMLCTDGCYFISLDNPGMLVPARHHCWHEEIGESGYTVYCLAPIHSADLGWKVFRRGELRLAVCRVHQEKPF
jgi:hypothetical protein